ncbi:pyridoxamine 5'-phosphate oxidase family protein [Micromonospora chersina]|uniref:pyridoxamine 5'-phosphate oxidase family protein n=1 Tax=Micromonospora chersina TaxID=47854 RepID=UPI0033F1BCDC
MTTREITSPEELAELLGAPTRRARDKERTVLHQRDREWLAAAPFCLVATAGADGSCDVSPKGDPAGFTLVLDETTIAIPERPGNRRADGYRNILANPHVGLLFLIPGRTDTLRINGRARLVADAPYFADMEVEGHRPVLAVEVSIEQIFYHCAKAFLRSELWQPDTWRPDALPTRARLVKEVEAPTENLADLERHYGPDYARKLYV